MTGGANGEHAGMNRNLRPNSSEIRGGATVIRVADYHKYGQRIAIPMRSERRKWGNQILAEQDVTKNVVVNRRIVLKVNTMLKYSDIVISRTNYWYQPPEGDKTMPKRVLTEPKQKTWMQPQM